VQTLKETADAKSWELVKKRKEREMNETLMQVFERVHNPKLFSALIHSESYF